MAMATQQFRIYVSILFKQTKSKLSINAHKNNSKNFSDTKLGHGMMSNATSTARNSDTSDYGRDNRSDTGYNIDDDCDNDLGYPETQPRSLAALAERDRQRELVYQKQQQLLQQRSVPACNSNAAASDDRQQRQQRNGMGSSGSSATDQISCAMIVDGSVSSVQQQQQQQQPYTIYTANNNNNNSTATLDVVDSVNVNGRQIIALNAKNIITNNITNNRKSNSSGSSASGNRISSSLNNLNNSGNHSDSVGEKRQTNTMNRNSANVIGPREYVLTPMVDKKPRSGGFLSRFAGFRFSLRGSKKKQKNVEVNDPMYGIEHNVVMVTKTMQQPTAATTAPSSRPLATATVRGRGENGGGGNSGGYQRNSMRSNDFVYIPLKDPIADKLFGGAPQDNNNKIVTTLNSSDVIPSPVKSFSSPNAPPQQPLVQQQQSQHQHSALPAVDTATTSQPNKKHVLTAKPPLPRLPPRVVGVCAKQPTTPIQQQQQQQPAIFREYQRGSSPNAAVSVAAQRPAAQRANSAPREINANDIRHYRMATANDDDVDFYHQQYRFDSRGMNPNGNHGVGALYGGDGNGHSAGYANCDGAVLRAGDPNELSFTDNEANLTIAGDGSEYKIGLIETNLDTHETIISGKTRSLMELGPQQQYRGRLLPHARRTIGGGVGGGVGSGGAANVTVGDAGPMGKVGSSICEPRRPHKSMEFLLDKENQKLVLVSRHIFAHYLLYYIFNVLSNTIY